MFESRCAGMSIFSQNSDLFSSSLWLYRNDFRTIISIENYEVNETIRVTSKMLSDFKWYGSFLDDWHAPSVEHLLAYCKLVDERKMYGNVVTHCWGGTGRTACFLAAYWLYSNPYATAEYAFKRVREKYSEHSVEMKAQYNVLARFGDYLCRRASMDVDSPLVNSVVGHFHPTHKNDGIASDSGHKGSVATYRSTHCNLVMVSKAGVALSKGPYTCDERSLFPPHSTSSGLLPSYHGYTNLP
ncbi:hypothetical protein LJX77_26045 [Vibrio coralliilyticus]|nr:hypothetical protein [Vibrio coralliilyticus]